MFDYIDAQVQKALTMAQLRIPEQDLPILKKLLELPDDAIEELATALSQAKPSLLPQDFGKNLAGKIPRLPLSEILQIIRPLIGMYQARAEMAVPIPEFVEVVSGSIDSADAEFLNVSADARARFKQRLAKLLDYDQSLGVTAKALDVLTEQERSFCEARILTDIRSVFANASDKPIAGLVIHQLKIEFHQAGEHKEFYVALDESDIAKLRAVLDRAETKARSLKSLMEKAGVTVLEIH